MKRIIVSCVALAALVVPALAGPVNPNQNVPTNGTFGTDRAVWAPLGSDPGFAGAIAGRQGSNATDTLLWLYTTNSVYTAKALDSNPNPVACIPVLC